MRKLVHGNQNSIPNKQDVDLLESDCACASGAGVPRETSDKLCKAEEAHKAGKPCSEGSPHEAVKQCSEGSSHEAVKPCSEGRPCEAGKPCSEGSPHEAGKHCSEGSPCESEVLSRKKAKEKARRSAFALSFYDNTDIDVIAQKSYKSDMSDEELKRSRKRDWAYIFIGVPLLIGVIYLIALLIKTIE